MAFFQGISKYRSIFAFCFAISIFTAVNNGIIIKCHDANGMEEGGMGEGVEYSIELGYFTIYEEWR